MLCDQLPPYLCEATDDGGGGDVRVLRQHVNRVDDFFSGRVPPASIVVIVVVDACARCACEQVNERLGPFDTFEVGACAKLYVWFHACKVCPRWCCMDAVVEVVM